MALSVSIDCWGTLMKGNPTFSERKIEFVKNLFHKFDIGCFSDSEIEKSFSSVKKKLDQVINITGWQPSQKQIWDMLIFEVSGRLSVLSDNEYNVLIQSYYELALIHPPIPFCENTIEVFKSIAEIAEIKISSNTVFLPHSILLSFFIGNGIYKLVKEGEYYFSSSVNVSKPNSAMYGKDFHIGDNQITDYQGALRAGSKPIIINSNEKTIKDAYNIIIQSK